MEPVNSSLYAISLISILSGITGVFFDQKRIQKYTKYIISLIITISLIPATTSLISNLQNIDQFESELKHEQENNNNTTLKQTIESAIQESICSRFNVPYNSFTVEIILEDNQKEILLESIKITIKDKRYNGYAERFEAYIKTSFGCPINITQNLKE